MATRFLLVILIPALAMAGSIPQAKMEPEADSEHQFKAAYLCNFAKFVIWPAESFKDADSPLTFCTVGRDPFRGALDESVSGNKIGKRPLQVHHFKQPQDILGCQVLFLGSEENGRTAAILESLKQSAVLTVGESDHFIEQGGMIGFLVEENKVRFEINLHAAEMARLKISSKLLALAKRVIGKPESR